MEIKLPGKSGIADKVQSRRVRQKGRYTCTCTREVDGNHFDTVCILQACNSSAFPRISAFKKKNQRYKKNPRLIRGFTTFSKITKNRAIDPIPKCTMQCIPV